MRCLLRGLTFLWMTLHVVVQTPSVSRMLVRCSLILLSVTTLTLAVRDARAQDTSTVVLPEIEVEAMRGTETPATVPIAVAVRARSPEQLAFTPALDLAPVLTGLPGLQIDARGHYALGERVSVRGIGSDAPFGTRGVQVVLDGVPLTMPDGQAVLDVVEPALIRRAELVRGPASLFWGNASGGALFLSTRPGEAAAPVRLQVSGGSFGRLQTLAEVVRPLGAARLRAYASHDRLDGYRAYSAGVRTRAGLDVALPLTPTVRLHITSALAQQDTEHPGALKAEQVEADRRQARPLFEEDRAGKQSTQGQIGLRLDAELPFGRLDAAAYGLARQLDNPLPFAYITLDRLAGGTRLAWHAEQGPLKWSLGADAALQHDDRLNWNSEGGTRGDVRQLDQLETVAATAAFGTARLALAPRLGLSAGLRADRIHFEMEDRLTETDAAETQGDQSGSRTFVAWSPSIGLSYRLGAVLLFAGYRSAFETPTTTELVNRPGARTGGFNRELDPQRLHGLELGSRGALAAWNLMFDVALFVQRLDDAIVQVDTDEAGRAYFGNAGRLTQRGAELAIDWRQPSYEMTVSYTGARVRYASATDRPDESSRRDGARVPGVREHRADLSLTFKPDPFWLQSTLTVASDARVSDASDAVSAGYAVFDLHAGVRLGASGPVDLAPFAAVTNVFDHEYDASLIANDSYGRYYEPAAGRAFQVGLNATF